MVNLSCRVRVSDEVVDGELLKSFELSRQKYKKRKEQVGGPYPHAMHMQLACLSLVVGW
jgi:hypothetical protein